MADSGQKSLCDGQSHLEHAKNALFHASEAQKYAFFDPLFPLQAPQNHPFSAHFRAPHSGHIARIQMMLLAVPNF
jgi:hypothetical protein